MDNMNNEKQIIPEEVNSENKRKKNIKLLIYIICGIVLLVGIYLIIDNRVYEKIFKNIVESVDNYGNNVVINEEELEKKVKLSLIDIARDEGNRAGSTKDTIYVEGHKIFKSEVKNDNEIYVYLNAVYGGVVYNNGKYEESKVAQPLVMIFSIDENSNYNLNKTIFPTNGEGWLKPLEGIFPSDLLNEAANTDYRTEFYQNQINNYLLLVDSEKIEESVKKSLIQFAKTDKGEFGLSDEKDAIIAEGHRIFKSEIKNNNELYVYLNTEIRAYSKDGKSLSGITMPCILIFKKDENKELIYEKIITPTNGEGWLKSLEGIFPSDLLNEAANTDYRTSYYFNQIYAYLLEAKITLSDKATATFSSVFNYGVFGCGYEDSKILFNQKDVTINDLSEKNKLTIMMYSDKFNNIVRNNNDNPIKLSHNELNTIYKSVYGADAKSNSFEQDVKSFCTNMKFSKKINTDYEYYIESGCGCESDKITIEPIMYETINTGTTPEYVSNISVDVKCDSNSNLSCNNTSSIVGKYKVYYGYNSENNSTYIKSITYIK